MGLDAYINERVDGNIEEICYFRKFFPLENLAADIWARLPTNKRNGKRPDDFNCEALYLTESMLKQFESLCDNILSGEWVSGFSKLDTEAMLEHYSVYAKYLKKKLPEIHERVRDGKEVFYTSWW